VEITLRWLHDCSSVRRHASADLDRKPPMQIDANPFAYEFDLAKTALVLIDMQRDFIEPGGFGETLGNDVSLLEAIVPATKKTLEAWREAGGLVVHTREAHKP